MIESNSAIRFRDSTGSVDFAKMTNGTGVELYYDNSKKFETTSTGVEIYDHLDMDDNHTIRLGTGTDLQIWHSGSDSTILNQTGDLRIRTDSALKFENAAGNETLAIFNNNSYCQLYYDNSKKLETTSTGVKLGDGVGITLGDDNDILIKHQSSHFELTNSTGNTYFQANGQILLRGNHGGSTEEMITATAGSHVSLYYDNSQKFYTQSNKCVVAGHFYPESTNSYDLGHSSYRWNNIYVNDMHFANSPENTNSVDGTWGDWTLQEGDENIFMINNRTGKKYKMALQEVV